MVAAVGSYLGRIVQDALNIALYAAPGHYCISKTGLTDAKGLHTSTNYSEKPERVIRVMVLMSQ